MNDTLQEIRTWFAASSTQNESSYPLATVNQNCPAWVVRMKDGCYGVAIPYDGEPIDENFNDVRFYSRELKIGDILRNFLLLTSESEESREQFAFFCLSLVDPGTGGKLRNKIENYPIQWWKEWKELVGNASVDKKPYAVLGELIVFRELLKTSKKVWWQGARGASKDIDTEYGMYEVKSTTSRYSNTITIAGQFQLQQTSKDSFLVFNRFEKSSNGESINSIVKELVEQYGQSKEQLEKSLRKIGYREGKSSRNEKYFLNEQKIYQINSDFPQITPKSFKNNKIPDGIEKIEYVVNLSACKALTQKEYHQK